MNVPLNIDWQQILLHLFNFIILAGGLYFLLYKPVKQFMQKREEYYRQMDDSANEKLNEAKKTQAEYAEKLEAAKAEIDGMKAKAFRDADEIAKDHIAAADKEKDKILKDARAAAETETSRILAEANSEIEEIISKAIDKAILADKGNSFDEFLDAARRG